MIRAACTRLYTVWYFWRAGYSLRNALWMARRQRS